jgi:hypothetical protein
MESLATDSGSTGRLTSRESAGSEAVRTTRARSPKTVTEAIGAGSGVAADRAARARRRGTVAG